MAPNSRVDESDDLKIFEGQIRESYGRVVYSHKTHEKCADILLKRHAHIKIWQIVLSAITTAGFVAAIVTDEQWAAYIGAFISTVLLALNAYTKDHDLGEIAQKHRQAGADLWLIRERYISLLTDIHCSEDNLLDLSKRRDELLVDLHSVYSGAPSTMPKAYVSAQKALQKLEDLTFSDDEIDAFLPSELKRGDAPDQ